MTTSFIKKQENFICEQCNAEVVGNGYTNHCPVCLWSKHVDIHPGDRAESCKGLMRPIDVETKAGESVLVHQCVVCGHQKRNKASKNDDFKKVIEVSKKE